MNASESCARVQPLLYLVLEQEASAEEERAVGAHLAGCGACRQELERERELSRRLAPDRRPAERRSLVLRFLPLSTLCAALVALLWLLSSPQAYGSIAPTRCLPTLGFENGAELPLQAENHLVVEAQEKRTVEIRGQGTLRIAGPAVLELDRVVLDGGGEGWKLVLLRGQVEVQLGEQGRLVVASVHGIRELGPGLHVARIDRAWFAGAESRGESPGQLLALGHRQFFEQQDFAAAEASYTLAGSHPDADEEERRQARFYELAAVGRQERFEDALALGREYLAAYPGDETVPYVLFFQGVYCSRLGRAVEARAAWEDVLARVPGTDLAESARAELGRP